MREKLISRRCVLFIGGYEPAPPEHQHARFVRELGRFARTWNVEATAGAMAPSADGAVASWRVETRGPNWRVETDYVLLRWDDFVAADFGRPAWKRLPLGILALADFILSGTLMRYFATNWRYALFFLYPVLIVFAAIGAGLATGVAVADAWGSGWGGAAAAAVAAIILLLIAGRALRLSYLLDDWIFARDFARRRRPAVTARVAQFAETLITQMRNEGYDEVVLAGHSLGAPFSIDVLDHAVRLGPEIGGPQTRLHLLSTGSSLLKVALHPAAGWLREAVGRISAQTGIFWVEYQALVDVINFYKTDPVKALRLPAAGKPVIGIVRIRDMLSPEAYRRFARDFFRLHRQFVMGNDRRYFYDYFMLCCGPLPFEARVNDPDRAVAAFGADGSLTLREDKAS